ncbi:spermine oxidase [Lingula anatina]|uniref:Spermine oxidase n=1 Tax=Lingula anatina TaxID=7574 RepID=A0A1S3JN69_LINAN|nr:spermine oxidase [Lingula anatina]|eukprot:XP_013411818.1 spermine oxidase [Lingula anatina]
MQMESVRIVIVGAGVAGISAARELKKRGFRDVKILEASNRVGGRVLTKQYGPHIVELGAQWIHGQGENPIYKLAKANNLVNDTGDDSSSEESDNEAQYFTQFGEQIEGKIARDVTTVMNKLYIEGDRFYREGLPVDEGMLSVGSFFRRRFLDYLAACDDQPDRVSLKKGVFDSYVRFNMVDNGCDTMDEVCIKHWGCYLEYEGSQRDVELKHGYQPVLDLLVEDVQSDWIHFDKPVKSIQYNQDDPVSLKQQDLSSPVNAASCAKTSPVKVVCEDGDEFNADHVIVTSSLGFLKENSESFFQPPLPGVKTNALKRLKFGTVNKVYLEFEKPFWDENYDIILCWLENQPFTLSCIDSESISAKCPWYKDILSFDVLDKLPNVLEMWISGKSAVTMETVPDAELQAVVIEILRRFTNNANIPNPVKMTRTYWSGTPYILGSYSYLPVGASEKDICDLADPVPCQKNPLVLFAGEATSPHHFSTVHGAFSSGVREAMRLSILYGGKV